MRQPSPHRYRALGLSPHQGYGIPIHARRIGTGFELPVAPIARPLRNAAIVPVTT
ncbi:hypothetical protein NSERUTF1_7195 [Nocardia seriolae]|nr:hypothetical protein NSERUTF1_7195 [Nocardia seriolae]